MHFVIPNQLPPFVYVPIRAHLATGIARAVLAGCSLLFSTLLWVLGLVAQLDYFNSGCRDPICAGYGDLQVAFAVLLLLTHCGLVGVGCKIDKPAVVSSNNTSGGDTNVELASKAAESEQ